MRFLITLLMLSNFLLGCGEKIKIDLSDYKSVAPGDLSTVYTENDTLYRDARLQHIRRGKNMTYQMPQYNSKEEWEQRAARLRRHILIVTGLWPMPEKTPLNAKIYDRIDHEDYSIEKVYFESYPGFYVTGNLYRPKGKQGPFPAIISPHGHWPGGRIQNSDVNSVPARGINFARQGYVVFAYDMVGYQDSKQVSHRFANSRMHQLWGINLMGLQLWNSIRALDFITSLPNVDTTRIGCTGASGGGTQTFMVTAVDKRIKVAAPVNMISASFQGGCLCENAPGLRLETFNVEIGALAAPRPLLMVSTTQDWTKNTPTVEYPMMKTIYKLYNAEDKLKYVQLDYPHNYNRDSREAVYAWFARWLLGDEDAGKYKERPFTVEPPEKMLNFPGKQQPPGDMNEEKLTKYLQEIARKSLQKYWPDSKGKAQEFRRIYGVAFQDVLAAELPGEVELHEIGRAAGKDFLATRMLIARAGKKDWIPAVLYQPAQGLRRVVLVVHPAGKAALVAGDGLHPGKLVQQLLSQGKSVLAIDCFRTGEHVLPPGMKMRDEAISHFTTFNKTDTQERVQDILTAVGFLRENYKVSLLGLEQGGAWVMLAAGVLPQSQQVAADAMNANWMDDKFLLENLFTPGLARFGGLATAMALAAPTPISIYNGRSLQDMDSIEKAYRALGGKRIKVILTEIDLDTF